MKTPAPLISDRIPLLLLERGKLSVSGSFVVMNKESTKLNIPIRNIQLLVLGNGMSITSDAMYLCSKERCHLAQSKGGLSIHTIFHSGLYPNPERLSNQVILSRSLDSRLKIAKYIAKYKIKNLSVDGGDYIQRIEDSKTIENILGLEGAITKKEYKNLFGEQFARSSGDGDINKNISIINSILYSFITSVVCSLGYSPSIGFLHGHTRRGGLVFDVADMFKHKIYMANIELLSSGKNMARELSQLLMNNKNYFVKEIIKEIEIICGGAI